MHKARRTGTLAALLCLSLSAIATYAQSSDDEVTPQVQALYAQAKAAQQRGDNAEAIEKYRAMLKLAPHLAPAYNNLGMLYFNEHDYEHTKPQVLTYGARLKSRTMSTGIRAPAAWAPSGMGDRAQVR